MANTYLAFALIIYAVLEGIKENKELPEPADINLYKADSKTLCKFKQLPTDFKSACLLAANSDFIKDHIPEEIITLYCE